MARLGRVSPRWSIWLLPCALALVGCGGSSPVPGPEVPTIQGPEPWQAPRLERVWRRLRAEPPFISALMLVEGPAPRAFVDDYFDGFHATAVHLWEAGLPRQLADWEASGRPGLRFFAWVDKDGTSRDGGEVLGGIGPNRPGRVGFQVGDEPGLDDSGFPAVLPFRAGVEAVRRADPDALVVMNFSVGVRDLGAILDYAGGVLGIDIFSFDRYNLGRRQYATLELIRRYARKYHRPYWRYLYGYRQHADDQLTPSDLRWDAMSGLVYGFTGFTWFIYQNSSLGIAPAFFDGPGYEGPKSPLWSAAAGVNRDLAAYLEVMTHLWSADVRYRALLPALQPEGTRPWSRGAGGDPYLVGLDPVRGLGFESRAGPPGAPDDEGFEILAGFFRDDGGEHYVMLQNVRHARASPPNASEAPGTLRLRFDFAGAPPGLDPRRILIFDPVSRRPRAVALEPQGPLGGRVELRLAAGDVVLFRYATGRAFAGRRTRRGRAP